MILRRPFPSAFNVDFTEMLEFLHLLTANNRIVFSSVNNNAEFTASLCYHLLIMTGAILPEYTNHEEGKSDGDSSVAAAGTVLNIYSRNMKVSVGVV